MKFSEMPYVRPNPDEVKAEIAKLTEDLKTADSYAAAKEIFLKEQVWEKHIYTLDTLTSIRHSIDTRDSFYDAETEFFIELSPELSEYEQAWNRAMSESKWRKNFAEEYGDLMFLNNDIKQKTFSSEIIPQLKEESSLTHQYDKLLASAQVDFERKTYTLSQMTPFKTDGDDARRLAAWQAEGRWYKENQAELDRLYDELVRVRDDMGRKLGYDGYTQLGYYRMGRNCYTKDDVEKFRKAVVEYVVPLATEIRRVQAQRLGWNFPMSYDEEALMFREGNPRPCTTAEGILAHGKTFYEELSPQTGEFFNRMLDDELMDVLSTEGKEAGGYCTSIFDYEVPFIFANFNGTQGDVEVITHEAGHAFEAYVNRKRIPVNYIWPSMEACEVHSMSMEFFAWPWAEGFFGKDTKKFLYSHLADSLTFIPYGTAVDHFQHIVYEQPKLTAKERHGVWKELLGIYMPWLRLDGVVPFYGDGESWQMKHHIYDTPFYYIDYCLAQTVSLEFWAMIQKDQKNAWEKYMAYTEQGGSRVFTELLAHAGLESPFDAGCLKKVCEAAKAWLDAFDWTGVV